MLATSVLLLGLSLFALRSGGSLVNGKPGSSSAEASGAWTLINQQLTSGQSSGTSFLLIFSSRDLTPADPTFRSRVESALAPLCLPSSPLGSSSRRPDAAADFAN